MNDDYDNAHDDKSALAKHTPAPPEAPAWAVKAEARISDNYNCDPVADTARSYLDTHDIARLIWEEYQEHAREACPPPAAACPTEQGESLSQDELDVDAFNKWNRDIDYYTPTLWDAFVYGCAHARSTLQTPQPAAPIGHRELCEELKQVHDTLRINSFGREALVITNAIAALQRLAASLDAEIGARNGWWDNCKKAEADLLEVESELTAARAATDRLRGVLVLYEEVWEQIYEHCIGYGIYNHGGKTLDCTKFNNAHEAAKRALAEGGES